MTWSYSNAGNSDRDKVRFLCGDTNTNNQLVSDEDIDTILLEYPDQFMAAAETCDAISAKLSFDTDTNNAGLIVAASKRALAFDKLANKLRKKAGRSITITAGGQTVSERDTARADDSKLQPSFEVGMFDRDQNDDAENDLISNQ